MQSGQSACQYRVCDSRFCGSMAIWVSSSLCVSEGFVIVACVAAWLSGVSVEWG